MPRQAKSKEEIEFVFGFKQVLGGAIMLAFVFGGGYFWGLEAGHKRALQGQPSLLAFLERGGTPQPEPVEIPEVLLNPIEGDPATSEDRDTSPSRSVPAASELQPEADQPSQSATRERVKPEPGIKAKANASEPAEPGSAPVSVPETAEPARESQPPKPSSKNRLHYQIAALKVRTNAKALVDWLRSEGFKARIAPASDDGLFRVYVGPFRTDTDAASARDRLTKDGFTLMARNL